MEHIRDRALMAGWRRLVYTERSLYSFKSYHVTKPARSPRPLQVRWTRVSRGTRYREAPASAEEVRTKVESEFHALRPGELR